MLPAETNETATLQVYPFAFSYGCRSIGCRVARGNRLNLLRKSCRGTNFVVPTGQLSQREQACHVASFLNYEENSGQAAKPPRKHLKSDPIMRRIKQII
ncbi:unnamed protein product [Protopolystoma xenopodis]|uniref:Uncharacterized protein n=1 Tax=Protopolystoma xenopodis TaxID=117903 RepID=A0A3S5BRN6_9PLAT|nr:unnamed protein product [Protopolystoma xenopodis]